MPATYQRGETVTLKMDVKNSLNAAYDPDTSIKLAVWDSAGTALLPATTMPKESTGVYYYDLDTTAASAIGCYRVEYTTVHGSRASKATDFFTLEDRGVPATGFSVVSMADQIRSEIDVNPDAAGGKVPDRIMHLVRMLGRELWNQQHWLFRRASGILTVASGASTAAMPTDFKQLDGRLMRVTDNPGYTLFLTQNASAFQQSKDYLGTDADAGSPRIALLKYTGGVWQAQFWPAADDDYTFPFWYLKADPWRGSAPLADNIQISPTYWPEDFDIGWLAMCRFRILSKYRSDDSWMGFRSEWEKWTKATIEENDKTIACNDEPIPDTVADFAYQRSNTYPFLGDYSNWFGSY